MAVLEGKVAVVTGGARGLGRAYALRLAELGADVAVLDIDLDGARTFGEVLSAPTVGDEIRAMNRNAVAIQADLSRRDDVLEAFEQIRRELGSVDVLVNNAGGFLTPIERSAPSTCPESDFATSFDANFASTVNACQAAVPGMRQRGAGVIVNTSSQSGVTVYSGGRMAAYAAAKAAVTHYTRYLAAELGPFGIRANCIAPGIIMTSRVASQAAARGVGTGDQANAIPMRRLGTTEDCVGVVEFLVTDLSRYVTGQCICVDGGAVLTPS